MVRHREHRCPTLTGGGLHSGPRGGDALGTLSSTEPFPLTLACLEGIGSKLAFGFRCLAQYITGLTIGFVYSWDMTLVVLAMSPLVTFALWFLNKTNTEAEGLLSEAYASAGAIAKETLAGIKTVVSLNAEQKQSAAYSESCDQAKAAGIKKATGLGL